MPSAAVMVEVVVRKEKQKTWLVPGRSACSDLLRQARGAST